MSEYSYRSHGHGSRRSVASSAGRSVLSNASRCSLSVASAACAMPYSAHQAVASSIGAAGPAASRPVTGNVGSTRGSAAGSRAGSRAGSMAGSVAGSVAGSRPATGMSSWAEPGSFVQSASAPLLENFFKHEGLPIITECSPSQLSRRVMSQRLYNGGLASDAPAWKIESGAQPLLPSTHRMLSRGVWSNCNPNYNHYPEESEHRGALIDHKIKETEKAFNFPRDKFTEYTECKFEVGNKQIMRSGGSSMAKKP